MGSLRAPCDDLEEESASSISQKRPFHKIKNKSTVFKAADFARRRKAYFLVIPAKAGIQRFDIVRNSLDPGFHRGDAFFCDPENGLFFPSFSHKQGAHGIRVVNALDGFSEQLCHRKNLDFTAFFRFFAQRNRIGHHQLLDGRPFDPFYCRS